jgi:hypothetical protein
MSTQGLQIINLLEPKDYQAGAQDMDSVHMGKLHRLTIAIQLGVITGEDPVFKLYAGATAGTKTTELPFSYRVSGADFGVTAADVFGARTAVAIGGTGLTLNPVANYDHRVIQIDVMSDQMPDGKPWLTVETDDGSASVLLMSALGIGWPRNLGDTHMTAL